MNFSSTHCDLKEISIWKWLQYCYIQNVCISDLNKAFVELFFYQYVNFKLYHFTLGFWIRIRVFWSDLNPGSKWCRSWFSKSKKSGLKSNRQKNKRVILLDYNRKDSDPGCFTRIGSGSRSVFSPSRSEPDPFFSFSQVRSGS